MTEHAPVIISDLVRVEAISICRVKRVILSLDSSLLHSESQHLAHLIRLRRGRLQIDHSSIWLPGRGTYGIQIYFLDLSYSPPAFGLLASSALTTALACFA